MTSETIMNIFPGDDEDSRLVIAVEQNDEGPSRLVLRQETRGGKLGWFVQSRVAVLPEQIAGLRMALSGGQTQAIHHQRRDPGHAPAILSFAEAAGQVG